MNAWTMLLLSAVLCALSQLPSPCVAVPAASSAPQRIFSSGRLSRAIELVNDTELVTELVTELADDTGLEPELVNDTDIASLLRRVTRSPSSSSAENNATDDYRGVVEKILNRFGELEGASVDELTNLACLVLSRIGAVYRSWLQTVESTIDALNLNSNASSDTGQRARRSPLALSDFLPSISTLPANLSGALRNPLGLLRQSVENAQNLIADRFRSTFVSIVNTIWNVLVTQIFPRVRSVLDQIQRTNGLPIPVSNAIQSLDTVLDLARMLSSFRAA